MFDAVRDDLTAFAAPLAIANLQFVPISALRGDFVVERGSAIGWYDGPTLLELLEGIHEEDAAATRPLRFPVQLVSRPGAANEARGYMGRIESGSVLPGAEVSVLPSGRSTRRDRHRHARRRAVGRRWPATRVTLLLRDELDISRGDMLADPAHPPRVAKNVDALVCWFSDEPFSAAAAATCSSTRRARSRRVFRAVNYRVDIHTLEHEPAPGGDLR